MNEITWSLKTFQIDELTDYAKNPRSLTKQQFEQLKKSLDKFGLIDKPIINADEKNTVIGGHQRLRVLRAEGQKSVECWIPSRELDEKEVEELNIRLNKNTGSWDFDCLANSFELDDLLDWGFDKGELDLDLWAEDAPEDVEPQIDKAEELREKWGVESGQLWKLGEHRLICGDCTDRAVVERVMGGEKADCAFTSPPYNGNTELNSHKIVDGKRVYTSNDLYLDNEMDNKTSEEYVEFNRKVFETFLLAVKDDGNVFYNISYNKKSRSEFVHVIANAISDGFNLYETIVWLKKGMPNPAIDVLTRDFEFIFLLNRSKTYRTNKTYSAPSSNVWEISNQGSQTELHHACFPVELPSKALSDTTRPGEIVYEPFSGSGTTIIACERLGRKCRAVEISPAYVAVAIQRWVDVTGGVPVLLSN